MKDKILDDIVAEIVHSNISYLVQMSHVLENAINERINNIAEDKKQYRDSQIMFIEMDEYYNKQVTLFPQMIRSFLLVNCCSFVENELNTICKYYELKNKTTIKLSDMKGQGISRAKTYLEKVVGINFPDDSNEWSKIGEYVKIRNYIVHNDSILDENERSRAIRKFIEAEVNISIDNNRVYFNDKFIIYEVLEDIRGFFDKLWFVLK